MLKGHVELGEVGIVLCYNILYIQESAAEEDSSWSGKDEQWHA